MIRVDMMCMTRSIKSLYYILNNTIALKSYCNIMLSMYSSIATDITYQ